MERVTVDYTRFQDIGDDDENELPSQSYENEGSYGALEFADGVSEEEQRQLTQLVTGESYWPHKENSLSLNKI